MDNTYHGRERKKIIFLHDFILLRRELQLFIEKLICYEAMAKYIFYLTFDMILIISGEVWTIKNFN